MISLGRFQYPDPVVVLAPMAGTTDLPFRKLCQHFGADFSVAEMISAKPDLFTSDLAQTRIHFANDNKHPKIVQLVGSDPRLMAEAAQLIQAKGADVIDLNMGCPSKSVGKHLAGSALLADEAQVCAIIRATVNAVSIPVTLKTRLGLHSQHINIERIAHIAQDNGIALLSIHGRTRAQKFKGTVDYQTIGTVKQTLSIPVIANGDITTPAQGKTLIERYGFDGIMLGRISQGKPWIFADFQQHINQRQPPSAVKQPIISQHINALHQLYGQQATYIARKHLHWYYQHTAQYATIRRHINQANNQQTQLELIQQYNHSDRSVIHGKLRD